MADSYIDYWEVGEYGGYFVEHAETLVGASPLVNVEEVRALVASAVAKVAGELEKSGIKRSSLRQGRGDTDAAADTARDDMRRFFMFLRSLADTGSLDIEACFPGNKLGNVSLLKPHDLKARLDEIIRALDLPANSAVPQRATWKSTLTSTRDALATALSSKGHASRGTTQGSAGLRQARDEFLHVYNGVAKPITRGLLRSLGRDTELRLFFRDLQVSESSRLASTTPEPEPAPDATPDLA